MKKRASFAIYALLMALLLSIAAQARTPRSAAEISAFKRENPCPATQLRRGACPGYQIDHPDPICAGGADHRDNMQWLTVEEHRMKTRSDVRMCRLIKKVVKDQGKTFNTPQ